MQPLIAGFPRYNPPWGFPSPQRLMVQALKAYESSQRKGSDEFNPFFILFVLFFLATFPQKNATENATDSLTSPFGQVIVLTAVAMAIANLITVFSVEYLVTLKFYIVQVAVDARRLGF